MPDVPEINNNEIFESITGHPIKLKPYINPRPDQPKPKDEQTNEPSTPDNN